jgi:hypothetical protein
VFKLGQAVVTAAGRRATVVTTDIHSPKTVEIDIDGRRVWVLATSLKLDSAEVTKRHID